MNSLAVGRPHEPEKGEPCRPDREPCTDADGLIQQCSHCSRVESQAERRWDWLDEPPDEASHSICPICFEYFFPGQ